MKAHTANSPAPAINEQTSLLVYNGKNIAFENIKGTMMVNATQMAKPFGKRPVDWLNTQQAKDLIQTISKVRKITLTDLQVVVRGGNNPGTWFHEDVALMFAQWLSPEFYLMCNDKLKELLKNGNSSQLAQNATRYTEETFYTVPMGRESNHIYVRNGIIYANFKKITDYLGYRSSPSSSQIKRAGESTLIQLPYASHSAWFIAREGFERLVANMHNVPAEKLWAIRRSVFQVEVPDEKWFDYRYGFTERELLEILEEVNYRFCDTRRVTELLLKGKIEQVQKGGM